MSSRFYGLGMCSLICIVACGCGGGGPELGTVTGNVTMDGKPLPNALVSFIPEGGGRDATGTTDEGGKYTLVFLDRNGALVGKHRVRVITLPTSIGTNEITSDSPEYEKQALGTGSATAKPFKETIPPRYNTNSELVKEVKAGSNVIDLELTSK